MVTVGQLCIQHNNDDDDDDVLLCPGLWSAPLCACTTDVQVLAELPPPPHLLQQRDAPLHLLLSLLSEEVYFPQWLLLFYPKLLPHSLQHHTRWQNVQLSPPQLYTVGNPLPYQQNLASTSASAQVDNERSNEWWSSSLALISAPLWALTTVVQVLALVGPFLSFSSSTSSPTTQWSSPPSPQSSLWRALLMHPSSSTPWPPQTGLMPYHARRLHQGYET